MNIIIGEIRILPLRIAPNGWELCEGQLLKISQHPELFHVIGSKYGGNGVETFSLPDLRDRPLGETSDIPLYYIIAAKNQEP